MVFCVSKENNTVLQNISINSVAFDLASVRWVAPEGQTDFRNGQSDMVTGTTKDGESYNVIFNDFPEESGEETYFHITDRSSANQDELYRLTDMSKFK